LKPTISATFITTVVSTIMKNGHKVSWVMSPLAYIGTGQFMPHKTPKTACGMKRIVKIVNTFEISSKSF